MANILIVTTSSDALAPDKPTGLWLEEFAVPYTEFAQAGASITVASPKGGAVPLDPKTQPNDKEKEKWAEALQALSSTKLVSEVSADDFDAIYIPGGHGTMMDLTDNLQLQQLIAEFDSQGKAIAAVCHGPVALINVIKKDSGEPLVKGRKVSGFTNIEERLVLLHDAVPFLLEDALKEKGADFEGALLPMTSHVVRDGNLITGQNPASSQKIAEKLLAALKEGSKASV